MTGLQAIIVYAVCWWLLLFMALPFGVRPMDDPQAGLSRAAPQKTYLPVKCGIVTVLAALVTYGIAMLIQSGLIAVR